MFMTRWRSLPNHGFLRRKGFIGSRELIFLIFLTHASAVFSISSMRCGNNLIELGDDKNKVLEICGEPESVASRTKIVGSTLHHPRRTLDIQVYEEIQVEEWIYKHGRNRIRQSLRFENGLLIEIKDLGRSNRSR